ncbi:MAG: endo-1,4-beta-xylanase [Caldilineaceae bacterium]
MHHITKLRLHEKNELSLASTSESPHAYSCGDQRNSIFQRICHGMFWGKSRNHFCFLIKLICTLCLVIIFNFALRAVSIAQTETETTIEHLRDLADRHELLIGAAIDTAFWDLPDTLIYQNVITNEFNIVTPVAAFKWLSLRPERDQYNFSYTDRYVTFAKAHNMKVHGNTLVWHAWNPDWFEDLPNDQVEMVMYEYIDTVMNHYKGNVYIWDVVNEALHMDGRWRTNSKYFEAMGASYIQKAFERAASVDPSAILIYNDYDVATLNPKSDGMYRMVVDLLSKGVPIHGIGFQMHITTDFDDFDSLEKNMSRFANLGLDIYITELDVVAPTPNDLRQAFVYEEILKKCLAQPHCKAFQMWGFTDKYSWKLEHSHPLIFDIEYKPKLAYHAMQRVFLASDSVSSKAQQLGTTIEPDFQMTPPISELREGEAQELYSFESHINRRYRVKVRHLAKSSDLRSIYLYINGSRIITLSYSVYNIELKVYSNQ